MDIDKSIKHLDRVCDALAQAAFDLSQSKDYQAAAALVTVEQILDDMGDRLTELRGLRKTVKGE